MNLVHCADLKKQILDIPNWRGSVCITDSEGKDVHVSTGFKNHQTKDLVTEETLFAIASCSKMMVGAGILKLKEMGKVNLDRSIAFYIPELKSKNKMWSSVTIRHLTNHLAGNGEFYSTSFYQENEFKRKIEFKDILENIQNVFFISKPGEKYNYSNLGYILLGEVISRVSRKGLIDFFNQEIFKPAGLTNTFIGIKQVDLKKVAPSYKRAAGMPIDYMVFANIKDPHLNITFTDGNIFSTPCDQMKWLRALIDGKILKKKEILDEYFAPDPNEYAFGLFRFKENDQWFLNHAGAWLGYQNYLLFNKDSKRGYVLATHDMTNEEVKLFSKELQKLIRK